MLSLLSSGIGSLCPTTALQAERERERERERFKLNTADIFESLLYQWFLRLVMRNTAPPEHHVSGCPQLPSALVMNIIFTTSSGQTIGGTTVGSNHREL
jgi:hypothetical protein